MTNRFIILVSFSIVLGGCLHEKPTVVYMPDMVYSPALKAQSGGMRVPPANTIPRNYVPYHYEEPEEAGKELKNPLLPNKSVIMRGKNMFSVYCSVCHGQQGDGNGTVVPPFPMPPSLHSEKLLNWPDGSIFHVITKGQNLMPSYASQIESSDRWAIIHYIRLFQRAKKPTPQDLKAFGQENQ
jgi:hypothetical protein